MEDTLSSQEGKTARVFHIVSGSHTFEDVSSVKDTVSYPGAIHHVLALSRNAHREKSQNFTFDLAALFSGMGVSYDESIRNRSRFIRLIRLSRRITLFEPSLIVCWGYKAYLYGCLAGLLAAASVPRLLFVKRTSVSLQKFSIVKALLYKSVKLLSLFSRFIVCSAQSVYQFHSAEGFQKKRLLLLEASCGAKNIPLNEGLCLRSKTFYTDDENTILLCLVVNKADSNEFSTCARAMNQLISRMSNCFFLILNNTKNFSNEAIVARLNSFGVHSDTAIEFFKEDRQLRGADIIIVCDDTEMVISRTLFSGIAYGAYPIVVGREAYKEVIGKFGRVVRPFDYDELVSLLLSECTRKVSQRKTLSYERASEMRKMHGLEAFHKRFGEVLGKALT